MIKVFCDKKEKDLKNFWSHIVFHPTDAIEDDWGQAFLDKMATDKAVKTIRIYSIFEEMVTLDENGKMQFDFTKNDFRIDSLLEKGFDIFIAYAFIPVWLAADQSSELCSERYKGNILVRSKPYDYSIWEEICRVYTQHLVDRYGEEQVSKWRLHCYNEPDWYHFFDKPAPDNYTRAMEYCKLYDAFARGVISVSEKLCIGGPALAESPKNFEFFELFLNHIKEAGTRLDFISFHSYGTFPELIEDKTKPIDSRGAMFCTMTVARIAEMCGFGHLPLVCDEWGAITEGYLDKERIPEMVFRENELYAAYYVRMLTMFDELKLPYEQMMICLSGQHGLRGDFMGNRNFFTKSFYPKPIYNAYVLAAKLGEEKLHFYADLENEHVSVMPTKHKDGHYSVLLCYADDGFALDLPTHNFEINLSGLKGKYQVTQYVIDKDTANAYSKFVELGEPQNATEEQKKAIREAGTLKPESLGTVSKENPCVALTMQNNAVVLLEIEPA
ncbi:MAG: hypothetical protein II997_00920 [Clostridia bacterium]|nr:hypothetical protein [Clostridia bacterium]